MRAPDQVWNYIAKVQKRADGVKVAKDIVTLLFCSNGSENCILKPLLLNRALKPRLMKSALHGKQKRLGCHRYIY